MHRFSPGFTMIELLVTLSIFTVLTSLVLVNVLHAPAQASLATATSTLVSDIKSQQLRSMLGDTDNTTSAQIFGLYFQPTQYTLFDSPYVSNASTNFVITLSSNLALSNITFPSGQLVFNRRSGEVNNFANNTNSLIIQNVTDGTQHVITVNRYGGVTVN